MISSWKREARKRLKTKEWKLKSGINSLEKESKKKRKIYKKKNARHFG